MKEHTIGLYYRGKVAQKPGEPTNTIHSSPIIRIEWNDKKRDWLELEFKDGWYNPVPRELTHSLFEDIRQVKKMIRWIS